MYLALELGIELARESSRFVKMRKSLPTEAAASAGITCVHVKMPYVAIPKQHLFSQTESFGSSQVEFLEAELELNVLNVILDLERNEKVLILDTIFTHSGKIKGCEFTDAEQHLAIVDALLLKGWRVITRVTKNGEGGYAGEVIDRPF